MMRTGFIHLMFGSSEIMPGYPVIRQIPAELVKEVALKIRVAFSHLQTKEYDSRQRYSFHVISTITLEEESTIKEWINELIERSDDESIRC